MQSRSITAIIVVLSLVIASLLVAGCTSSLNPSPSPTASQHDAFLSGYLSAIHTNLINVYGSNLQAYNDTWINGTSAQQAYAILDTNTGNTLSYTFTMTVFPATQDATNYINAMNNGAKYSLISTTPNTTLIYNTVTGHLPQVYRSYKWEEGTVNSVGYEEHFIEQYDNFVRAGEGKIIS